jgi:predicted AlkP superfamily pyrophosphatase or phosphodiesterase
MTNKGIISFLMVGVLSLLGACTSAQKAAKQDKQPAAAHRPRIIVGITVDQMRADYIEKYWNDYSEGGFKRLVDEGFFARNLQYNYMPTYTGPGHAAIYTGTTPPYNGIIANDWYERSTGKMVYCSSDSTAKGVGTSSAAGKMSPHYLMSTTLGDELKLFSNKRSKVIGVALKDRGAILPAGRTADAAYWFVGGDEGVWATSNWYMNELPKWVTDFNAEKKADAYLKQEWTMLKPESTYDESLPDNNAYELPFKGLTRPVFPYKLDELRKTNMNYDLLKATPFGNTLTLDFAKAAIENEKLGQDEFTDMLCLSFSATDYIGHQFGIHARETQDCYLRLDQDLAALINYMDEKFGRDQYLMFLSADHAGAPTPSYMMTDSAAAGYWKSDLIETQVNEFLSKKYGEAKWVESEVNQNIFLDRKLIDEKKLDLKRIQMEVAQFVSTKDDVYMAFNAADLDRLSIHTPIAQKVQMGYSQKMSGDVLYVLNPGYMEYSMQGTTHGSPFVYDSHVPALFFGYTVKPGETFESLTICDIAPTIAALCKITAPSAAIGQPIKKIVE